MKRLHPVAHRRHHAFNLMVFPLRERQPQMVAVYRLTCRCPHGFGVIIQHHPFQQLVHLAVVQWVFGGDLIDFGNMMPGGADAVDELDVIGQQQQPGRVLIQPPHCLNALHRPFLRP